MAKKVSLLKMLLSKRIAKRLVIEAVFFSAILIGVPFFMIIRLAYDMSWIVFVFMLFAFILSTVIFIVADIYFNDKKRIHFKKR